MKILGALDPHLATGTTTLAWCWRITRATTAGAHALLGACAASGGVWWLGMAVAAVYWLWKERADMARGGSWRDGVEDMACVWLGTAYGPWWWPFVMGAVMAYIMAMDAVRRLL